jgi:class III poly(R)-hydroxyalkanoic acid synthase PhaE subunit
MSTQWPGDFDALARQYWASWGNAMRGDVVGNGPAGVNSTPNWQDAVDWWSMLAHGGSEDANSAVERFNAQARDWYGQMQQVAAQFAGRDAKPVDIAAKWKRALGGIAENPFSQMFGAMKGQGAQGLEQWIEDAAPYLKAWRRESNTMLGMPTFGIGREQQERWQKLAKAQLEYQQQDDAYNALMLKAVQDAYVAFEDKLAEREEPGRQLTTARALFDLWIDAAEEAYARIALSPEFRKVYGARVNAQMRLRQRVQGEVEQMSAMFGMPTRSDLDAAFRKIDALERGLRKMRDELTIAAEANAQKPSPPPATAKSAPTLQKTPSKQRNGKKTAVKKTSVIAPKKSATGKSK